MTDEQASPSAPVSGKASGNEALGKLLLFLAAGGVLLGVGTNSSKPSSATPGPVAAANATAPYQITNPGYLASSSEQLLSKATAYAVDNDFVALAKLMSTGLVVRLDAGREVRIVDRKLLGGIVKIRAKGETAELWTPREAVR